MRISSSTIFSRSSDNMISQQATLSKTQQMVSTGRRIINASDDPTASARILDINGSLAKIDQQTTTQDSARTQLDLLSGAIDSSVSLMQSVRDIALQGAGPNVTAQSRATMAATLRSYGDQMLGYANTKDSGGGSIFSGFQTDKNAFVQAGSDVIYQGDSGVRQASVSSGRNMTFSIPGDEMFNQIKTGNGYFDAQPTSTNTGTAIPTNINAYDRTLLTGNNYTITFSGAGATQTYSVLNETSGATLVSGASIGSSKTIKFDGIAFSIDGDANSGDSVKINSAPYKSVFKTINDLAAALEAPATTPSQVANLRNAAGSAIREIDNATNHFVDKGATVGVRSKEIDALSSMAQDTQALLLKEKGKLQDLDYSSALTMLASQETQLKAAQISFSKISQLSIFDYIR